jgi:hypothetical protein
MSLTISKTQLLFYFTKIDAYSYKCKTGNKIYKTSNRGIGNLKTHYATHLKNSLDKIVPGKRKSQTVNQLILKILMQRKIFLMKVKP